MPSEISFNSKDQSVLNLLKKVKPFQNLDSAELLLIAPILRKEKYKKDEIVVSEGESGSSVYIVATGIFRLSIMDREVTQFSTGDSFGEIALIDAHPRMGTVYAVRTSTLFRLDGKDLNNEALIPASVSKKIYLGFRADDLFLSAPGIDTLRYDGCFTCSGWRMRARI